VGFRTQVLLWTFANRAIINVTPGILRPYTTTHLQMVSLFQHYSDIFRWPGSQHGAAMHGWSRKPIPVLPNIIAMLAACIIGG